MIIWGQNTVDV